MDVSEARDIWWRECVQVCKVVGGEIEFPAANNILFHFFCDM